MTSIQTMARAMLFLLVILSGKDFSRVSSWSTRTPKFCVTAPYPYRTGQAKRHVAPLWMAEDLFADIAVTVKTSDFYSTFGEKVVDKNGKEFELGSVVRVCVDGLKAFQISSKGQGRYVDKIFVADVSDASNKYLVLPAGLRGTVTKVYDENVISANLPIQVKFNPGTNMEEGYDPPTAFLMHFMAHELECV